MMPQSPGWQSCRLALFKESYSDPEKQKRFPGILLVYLHMKPNLVILWLGWNRDGQEEYVCLNFSRKFCIPNCFLWSVSSTYPWAFFFFSGLFDNVFCFQKEKSLSPLAWLYSGWRNAALTLQMLGQRYPSQETAPTSQTQPKNMPASYKEKKINN